MKLNLVERKPIWIALSDFYLDTELQDYDFAYIIRTIQENPYTVEQVKEINKYEVFPVLQHNLLIIGGVWTGIDEKWLCESIQTSLDKRTKLRKIWLEISYVCYKSMCGDYWEEVEKRYHQKAI